jgi:hypothetical protein
MASSLAERIRIFVCFDLDHDTDLQEQLVEQSSLPISRFEISGRSEGRVVTQLWAENVRRQICEADQVIVICGEHTGESNAVSAELRIAQEEHRPYFLLWGRREVMCTKPAAARPADGMYSWTREILHSQMTQTLRKARFREG